MSVEATEWRALLKASAEHYHRCREEKRQAGVYLWLAACATIRAWDKSADPKAELLYREVVNVLGKARKSSASKIKYVALADLELDSYATLNMAYSEARRRAAEADPATPCTCHCHH